MTAVQNQPGAMDIDTSPQAGPSSASAAAVYKRLHPASYLSRYLSKGYRPDGRKTAGWRDVSVNLGVFLTDPMAHLSDADARVYIYCERILTRADGRDDNGLRDQGRGGRT